MKIEAVLRPQVEVEVTSRQTPREISLSGGYWGYRPVTFAL